MICTIVNGVNNITGNVKQTREERCKLLQKHLMLNDTRVTCFLEVCPHDSNCILDLLQKPNKQRDKHTNYYHAHQNNKKEQDYRYSKNTQVSKYGFKFTIMLAFLQESIEDTRITSFDQWRWNIYFKIKTFPSQTCIKFHDIEYLLWLCFNLPNDSLGR